jgi:hypothetical protein
MSVPSLNIKTDKLSANSKAKIEALQADLSKLDMESSVALSSQSTIPTFQRQGYLEKLGHTRHKWFKRFFVLRDSVMLSYNLAKSDFTTEPRSAVHLGNCKVVCCSPGTNDRDFCFSVLTETGDQFLFSATSEVERQAWVDDILVARQVTHANMVKIAVENQCLAEEKGLASGQRDASTDSLTVFSNPSYVQDTPLTGGMEGWLSTTGFNVQGEAGFLKKTTWKRNYFMLRDSHLLMFHAGDILSKPRGVMYLVGTVTEVQEDASDVPFRFIVRSRTCGDMIELAASSHKSMMRWKQALTVASRVTYPDYRLLEKERQLLASIVLTPRAPTPRGPGGTPELQTPPSVLDEEVDIQGNPLPPGAVQPYDETGVPYLRRPDGMLVDINTGKVLPPTAPRFSADGEPLDSFNRPLPPNAVPMFSSEGKPIGVGPDGQHYTADGAVISGEKFDAQGKVLDSATVQAAEQVAPTIAVAMKVRAKLKGDDHVEEYVDPLGRAFKSTGGEMVNQEGDVVPPTSARKIDVGGNMVSYEEVKKQEAAKPKDEKKTLNVKMESEVGEVDLGTVEVSGDQTLANVRSAIASDLNVPEFVFMLNGVPLTKLEEKSRLAIKMDELYIRGQELKTEAPAKKITAKVAVIQREQEQKQNEESEFLDIMAKVKSGQFLRSVGRDLTK